MKRTLSSKFIAAAVLAAAALGAATAAQARTDVQVSIGLPGLPVFVPPPLHGHAGPVIVPPRQIYGPPPAVVHGRPWRESYRPDLERERAWQHAEQQRRERERRDWERREWERRHHGRDPSDHRRWD